MLVLYFRKITTEMCLLHLVYVLVQGLPCRVGLGRLRCLVFFTLLFMILSGPPVPLGGCLVLLLTRKSIENCRYRPYIWYLCILHVTGTGEVQVMGAYWYSSPLREDLTLLTDSAFLVFRRCSLHLSATLWLKKFRRSSEF